MLGMIQEGSEDLRLELCSGNCRPSKTLIPMIECHVAGTKVRTDGWRELESKSECELQAASGHAQSKRGGGGVKNFRFSPFSSSEIIQYQLEETQN